MNGEWKGRKKGRRRCWSDEKKKMRIKEEEKSINFFVVVYALQNEEKLRKFSPSTFDR